MTEARITTIEEAKAALDEALAAAEANVRRCSAEHEKSSGALSAAYSRSYELRQLRQRMDPLPEPVAPLAIAAE